MTRAQTEIIGVVIIVVIITVVMLIYLSFSVNDESSKQSMYKEYAYNEQSTSFVQALLKTYVSDCQATMEDLIVDCGTKRQIRCAGEGSCDYLNKTIIKIKNNTLDVWDRPYGLVIELSNYDTRSFIHRNCTRETVGRGAPGVFLIPYFPFPGTAKVELGICAT